MMLYVSLRGEAEEELEHCPLDSINNDDKGIDSILETEEAFDDAIYLP